MEAGKLKGIPLAHRAAIRWAARRIGTGADPLYWDAGPVSLTAFHATYLIASLVSLDAKLSCSSFRIALKSSAFDGFPPPTPPLTGPANSGCRGRG